MVADLHLGKAASFRRLGVPVPEGTTAGNLNQLTALIEAFQPLRLVFLGDFLHSRHAHAEPTLDAMAQWRQRHAALSLTLVRGNHDDRAGDPPPWFDIQCVDEPWPIAGTDLALCHHPQPVPGKLAVAGHWHPSVVIGRGFERARLPCFHLKDSVLVAPAFGVFTGTHPVTRDDGTRIFAIAADRVAEV